MTTIDAPATSPSQASLPRLEDEPSPGIAPEGRPILAGFVLVGSLVSLAALVGLYRVGYEPVGYGIAIVAGVLSLWCAWFFRDPSRRIPGAPDAVISPADGRVVMVGPAPIPPELNLSAAFPAGAVRVAVFMNVFSVHVNRSPVAGTIERIVYHPGKFFNASLDKASVDNERLSMAVRRADGRCVIAVQIAGLIARRIIWRVTEGEPITPGRRYGLIRFGSRVDVYLPPDAEVRVKVGDSATAGETVLARL